MIRLALILAIAAEGSPLCAQSYPMPGPDTPRVQSVSWIPGEPIVLTALPQTGLTVMLEPGETITRMTLGGSRTWDVFVSAESDSFQVVPQARAEAASLTVETDRRLYEFALETGRGLQAAYLVRLDFGVPLQARIPETKEDLQDLDWSYRIRGDKSVRPAMVRDNGSKTVIEYAPGQPLPAVFAVSATGDEEVVAGHMRGDQFVIDRVHDRLIFRIDKEKATARRNKKRESGG
ncbi:TrbG/VirB9 family P-type conjugative transfer protein [Erythrobacter sp. THAF29]|uniref:TrbG/VirB9 family P-type conjugative transfer protein n=1 Tax=Erythrobacter sp. THAF29 TaxID=2587851 RepID=UPI001267B5BF|nr:TrbG/VirB9 family P-type conjugative transfer protein [Erythrobacter sp. THAF29]QFT78515.1 Type IV secretion system protein virB9 precursor [Erythrobacter sp. THAF29]